MGFEKAGKQIVFLFILITLQNNKLTSLGETLIQN